MAVPANNVSLAGDYITRLEFGHGCTHAFNHTAEFMAHMHTYRNRLLGPGVPVPDMEVCAADGGLVNLDKNIIRTDLWHRYIHQFKAGAGGCFD